RLCRADSSPMMGCMEDPAQLLLAFIKEHEPGDRDDVVAVFAGLTLIGIAGAVQGAPARRPEDGRRRHQTVYRMRSMTISGVPKAQSRNGSETSCDFSLATAIGRRRRNRISSGSRIVSSVYGLGGFRSLLVPVKLLAERFPRPRQARAHGS